MQKVFESSDDVPSQEASLSNRPRSDGPTGSLKSKANLSRLLSVSFAALRPMAMSSSPLSRTLLTHYVDQAVRLTLMTAFTSGGSPYEKDSSNRGYGYIVSRCSKLQVRCPVGLMTPVSLNYFPKAKSHVVGPLSKSCLSSRSEYGLVASHIVNLHLT